MTNCIILHLRAPGAGQLSFLIHRPALAAEHTVPLLVKLFPVFDEKQASPLAAGHAQGRVERFPTREPRRCALFHVLLLRDLALVLIL